MITTDKMIDNVGDKITLADLRILKKQLTRNCSINKAKEQIKKIEEEFGFNFEESQELWRLTTSKYFVI